MSHFISLSGLAFPAIELEILKFTVSDPQTEQELANQIIHNLNTNQKAVFDHNG